MQNLMRKKKLRHLKGRFIVITAIFLTPVSLGVFAYSSYASGEPQTVATNDNYLISTINNGNTPLNYDYSLSIITNTPIAAIEGENSILVEDNTNQAKLEADKNAIACASDSGLGGYQADVIENAKKMDMTPINIDKIFDLKNGGCFSSLSNFPDLSVSIPSFSSIFTAMQKTLIDYGTRKVCNVVNSALEEAISPISEKITELNESRQLDLTGRVNKELTKKYYEVDPEMGRVSTKAQSSTKNEYSVTGKVD